jgi:RNA polymerase sigma-70 factor (ECF subfamily)
VIHVLTAGKVAVAREAEAQQPAAEIEIMNEREFHAFYVRTAAPLRGYAARVLGSVTEADDVVQDAYLRFLRKPPPTDDPQQMRAFLFRIASNLIADHWRRRKRERMAAESASDAGGMRGSGAGRGGPASDRAGVRGGAPMIDVPLRIDMARVFGQLKAQQRQLMWMAYVEGADHREIAAALNLGERSVRVLLHRARRKLAGLLRLSGHGER